MVCDYRALNKITVPDSSPIPLIDETIDQVAGSTVFSQLDLIWGYHQMRLKEEDCHKTAIRTRFGSFEWRVLCFGLTNAPAAFSRLLSSIFRKLIGECIVLYLDDILAFSKSIEDHRRHLRKVFSILRKHKFYLRPSKCKFGLEEVDYLGFKIYSTGIKTQDRLVKAVQEWPTPKNVKEVQRFLGLSNFYRRFMKNYSNAVVPLTNLTRTKKFQWTTEENNSFELVKQRLTEAPVLHHPSSSKTFVLTTDASKHAVGATLEQEGHPIAYLSHRLSDRETRWDTGDQELLAVMIALRSWSVYLRDRPFILKTDHEPIKYLQTKSKLTGRQMRWLDELQSHSFSTEHLPGSKNTAADALSRNAEEQQHQTSILKGLRLREKELQEKIRKEYSSDKWAKEIISYFANEKTMQASKKIKMYARNYKVENNFIYWIAGNMKRLYVPTTNNIIF